VRVKFHRIFDALEWRKIKELMGIRDGDERSLSKIETKMMKLCNDFEEFILDLLRN
jgi:hypothetical protein